MSFVIELRIEAQIDLDKIFGWYEEQKGDLGFEFIFEFEAVLNKISRNPYHASYILKQARSASLNRFPYHIIYEVDEQGTKVIVLAIAHHHRNPEWFRQRIRE
jgi:plasmid stabilization system protein ParE